MQRTENSHLYSLPIIQSIQFHNFDLYTEQPNVLVPIQKEVFCLIGANGLGKTTFLNTLIFGITGAIPYSTRKYLSAQKYFKDASRSERTKDYFEGRVAESNRSNAGVTVLLKWPNGSIRVTRNFFDDSEISALEIRRDGQSGTIKYDATNTDSQTDLHGVYAQHVNELTRLKDYAQFIFLVHYILTFDEDRHLLMWDDNALTEALYLAFGSNPGQAQKADKLRQDMERADSRGRNAKYAARLIADKMKFLADALANVEQDQELDEIQESELHSEHDDLIGRQQETDDRRAEKRIALQDVELKWTEASAALTEVQVDYQKVFSTYFQGRSSVHYHPMIKATISENRCAICATEGVADKISEAIDVGNCPLCKTELGVTASKSVETEQLKSLDKRITALKEEILNLLSKRDRLDAEHQAAMGAHEAAQEALVVFEETMGPQITGNSEEPTSTAVDEEIGRLENQHGELSKESRSLYKKRDEIRKELRVLETALAREYDKAALTFVPRFRELAEAFIGIDIDIVLKQHLSKTKSGFGLTLSMGGEPRQKAITVSESQGFFIDIALRMALSEYMADGPATLLIDTPEGSLDIAYEARAGAMFSNFTKAGNRILMTANLRSSELVIRLANRQGRDDMQIERMTEWTELSEVQKEEEELFERAYREISTALGS